MVTNVFFATTILFMAIAFYLLQELEFLIPYRDLLIAFTYGIVRIPSLVNSIFSGSSGEWGRSF